MTRKHLPFRSLVAASIFLVAACSDYPGVMSPEDADFNRGQDVAAMFRAASPEVLGIPQTVFASHDLETNQIVVGVENPGVTNGVQRAMLRMGIPASTYRVEITEPIEFMNTLRHRHRPVMGGLQLHWSQYVCTLGFSVDHAAGRSMITNSHCTNNQGSTGSTAYYQPASSVDGNPIAIEAHDPAYFKGGACPRSRQCRYSDAARALYVEGLGSLGHIAKTQSINTGNLTIDGSFNITGQNNTSTTFSGTMQKVGRTTGWTSGNVVNTCANVNVSGSNITLLCQTLVQRPSGSHQIVAGGDSGSPVFTGSSNVTLVGILWGGSGSGDLFVFSPLKNIIDELGSMNATTDGVGGGGNGGGDNGGGDDGGGDDGPNCPPNSNNPRCR